MAKTLLFVCVGVLVVPAAVLAGNNPDAKVAVHVVPHHYPSCENLPAITWCDDIITTEPSANVDAFPVFYYLTEYQEIAYSLSWPGTYYADFHGCAEYSTPSDGVVWPGDGISHVWTICQQQSTVIPAWFWIEEPIPARICVLPHPDPLIGTIRIVDCTSETDSIPAVEAKCAGIWGAWGDDPCFWPPEPLCIVEPAVLVFGPIVYGVDPPEEKTFSIRNGCIYNLVGEVASLTSDHFAITDPPGGGPYPYCLCPDHSIVFTVQYNPTALGIHECSIETGVYCDNVSCTGEAQANRVGQSSWGKIKSLFKD